MTNTRHCIIIPGVIKDCTPHPTNTRAHLKLTYITILTIIIIFFSFLGHSNARVATHQGRLHHANATLTDKKMTTLHHSTITHRDHHIIEVVVIYNIPNMSWHNNWPKRTIAQEQQGHNKNRK